MSSKKTMKKMQKLAFQKHKTTLETINLGPKQIKFLINIKNEKTISIRVSGFIDLKIILSTHQK